MSMKGFYLPTVIYKGRGCIRNNKNIFSGMGKHAFIVTGKNSARLSGVLQDVLDVLEEFKIKFTIYDSVMQNPTIQCVYKGSEAVKECGADFIIAIGGGSPMDCAKCIAALAVNDIDRTKLFKTKPDKALPMIHIPTTAGTGSEVTPYAILTNDEVSSKMTMSSDAMFPSVAFLDGEYLKGLPKNVMISTVVDALSHSVEGMLSKNSSVFSDALAKKSLEIISKYLNRLDENDFSFEERQELIEASCLAGMVISQVGTTVVHTMGYSLTYFKGILHGRANGLTLGVFLEEGIRTCGDRIREILGCLGMDSVEQLIDIFGKVLGSDYSITPAEIEKFSSITMKLAAKKLDSCIIPADEQLIKKIYKKSIRNED